MNANMFHSLKRTTLKLPSSNDYLKQSLVKNQDILEKEFDFCLICEDVPTFPVRCVLCQAVFCRECADHWNNISARCPKKCGEEWRYMDIEPFGLALDCPFSHECQEDITAQSFEAHLIMCQFMPLPIRLEIDHQKGYQCNCGKKLQLFDEEFQELMHLPCCLCDQLKLCRSACKDCDALFCISCRPIPFTKDVCLMGAHKYKYRKSNASSVCDVCGIQTFPLSRGTYEDESCNIAICEVCYDRLPEPKKKIRKGFRWWF